jgi:hypothetical protein
VTAPEPVSQEQTDRILAALDRVQDLAPGAELQLLRRVIEQRLSLEDATKLIVDTMGGGKRARETIRLVEAELATTDEATSEALVRYGKPCPGSGKPARQTRHSAVLPEVQCPAATCQRFLVVPLGRTETTPRHIYVGKAACAVRA